MYVLGTPRDNISGLDVNHKCGRDTLCDYISCLDVNHICGLDTLCDYMSGLDGLGGRGGQLAGLDDRLELFGDRLLYKILALRNQHVHLAGFGGHDLGLD